MVGRYIREGIAGNRANRSPVDPYSRDFGNSADGVIVNPVWFLKPTLTVPEGEIDPLPCTVADMV